MRYSILILLTFVFFACGNEKVIELPVINHSEINEINDVSPAYLFYDETQKDSVELNRKNLIVSTNWLVNVDKRLTLRQVLPHIQFLQSKKENSSHKNEHAKNYYTCNDLSRKDLGFIEFTDVVYFTEEDEILPENTYHVAVLDLNQIIVYGLEGADYKTNLNDLLATLEEATAVGIGERSIGLSFYDKLSFNDYIAFKSELSTLHLENVSVSNHEFIFN
ncbi:hypothetical protein F6U93_11975 [Tamlana haliotis]|uniref:Uncharacterized protein n=1 Tax=Pseudotamlana haliotis TaxID=2614804 RepID=A0A6N6MA41_9FLAO|nr:hypothetical protein [Tamlana haliotis]KAB1067133.1 hypothetical protein F6U93_11975 [Tamlana haliotis]